MLPLNVGYFLTLNANRYPEKTALVYQTERLTYRELNGRVNALAHSLLDLGIKKGDQIAYLLPNGTEIVQLFFAIAKIGAVAVPLNHRLVAREIQSLLQAVDCRLFVYSGQYRETVAAVRGSAPTVEAWVCTGGNSKTDKSNGCGNSNVISHRSGEGTAAAASGDFSCDLDNCSSKDAGDGQHLGMIAGNGIGSCHGRENDLDFTALCAHADQTEPDVQVLPEDLFRIQFTGGTTGRSKGVMRTHQGDLFQTISVMMSNRMVGPEEVVMTQCPLHHQAGITWMLCVFAAGARFVICDLFNPEEILARIQAEKVTYLLLLPPSTYLRLIDCPRLGEFDLSSVRVVQTSAGGTSPEIILRMYDAFPRGEVYFGWGQTESGAGTVGVISREAALHQPEKTKSVGRAMPFFEVRVVDEAGWDVIPGQVGEAAVRGPAVMAGYYHQPELTAAAMGDGWLRTGDMFRQDEEGLFYLVDRKKDMIKSGGENVFAQEVEAVIRGLSAVQDCAVIGVPDQCFGEAVMAVIKLRPGHSLTMAEVQAHCKTELASYKKPRRVEFVTEFPVDSAGKIQKFRLREQYRDMSGGSLPPGSC